MLYHLIIPHDKKAKGAKIRRKCEWYQHGENPTEFFLKSYKYNSKTIK